jgi:two-component system, NtrC family, sensor histidine kinase HydH
MSLPPWKKLVTPTVCVSLLWLVVGGVTIYYLDCVYSWQARDLAENFTTIQAADTMQDVLWRLQATVIEVAEQADTHTLLEVAELEDSFEGHLANADASTAGSDAKRVIAAIRTQFGEYRGEIQRRLTWKKSNVGSIDDISPPLSRSAHAIAESCKSLLTIQERLIADSTAQRSRMRAAFSQVMLTLWIIGPAVGIMWGVWVARWFHRSISRISISLKDAAGGLEHEVDRVHVLPSDDLPAVQEQVQRVSSRIKQVMEELHQARREAILADRLAAVGEMAAGVAHELRNPLTSVKLLMQTAAEGPGDQRLTEEHIHVVLEQVIRMENTIQGLLDFARPPQMQQVVHDLRDTLQRALNLTEGLARQQGVVVNRDCPNNPVLIDGDPELLHQVFVNLILNGVESMSDGGEMRITMKRVDTAGPTAKVLFTDTGSGIPAAVMQRIFEPFVTSKEHGTGLGLAISRRIVEQHGGQLTATNREPCGAEFAAILPLTTKPPAPTIFKGNGPCPPCSSLTTNRA